MRTLNILVTLLIGCFILGCGSKEPAVSTYAFYTYEAECLGTNHDGSQTLLVWGTGKSPKEASAAAVKEAVFTIMFKGINKGIGDCSAKPLVNKPNADKTYQVYLNSLLSNKSFYKKIVKGVEGHDAAKAHNGLYKVGQVVHIDVPALRQQLINDGIISTTH
ncbi:MAG: hypothetical protein E7087_03305 [Bacteroidales bacterium]|nr:hypothetical protein [Bacteroidales bacterium]